MTGPALALQQDTDGDLMTRNVAEWPNIRRLLDILRDKGLKDRDVCHDLSFNPGTFSNWKQRNRWSLSILKAMVHKYAPELSDDLRSTVVVTRSMRIDGLVTNARIEAWAKAFDRSGMAEQIEDQTPAPVPAPQPTDGVVEALVRLGAKLARERDQAKADLVVAEAKHRDQLAQMETIIRAGSQLNEELRLEIERLKDDVVTWQSLAESQPANPDLPPVTEAVAEALVRAADGQGDLLAELATIPKHSGRDE